MALFDWRDVFSGDDFLNETFGPAGVATITLPASTTPGNALLVLYGGEDGDLAGVADSASQTWTEVVVSANGANITVSGWLCPNMTGLAAGQQLTLSTGGAGIRPKTYKLIELDAVLTVDVTAADGGPTDRFGNTRNTGETTETDEAVELVVALLGYNSIADVTVPPAGFTDRGQAGPNVNPGNQGTPGLHVYSLVTSATGAQTAEATTTGAPYYAHCIMTFKGVLPPPAAPVNLVAPAVTGEAKVGQDLECGEGTWAKDPDTFAYQWMRNGVSIALATTDTHTVVNEDFEQEISCRVTATNELGSKVHVSNTVVPWLADAPATVMLCTFGGWVPRTARYVGDDGFWH